MRIRFVRPSRSRSLVALVTLPLLLLASGVRAQDHRSLPADVTAVNQSEIEKVPSSRDPWKILQSTPGVLTDRTDVGGDGPGRIRGLPGPGTAGGGFAVDGIVITDLAARGGTPRYYDLDSFEELPTLSGSDFDAGAVGGVLNVITRRGTSEWSGNGRYYLTDADFQDDLAPTGELRIDLREGDDGSLCLESGGPILKDRPWIFSSPRAGAPTPHDGFSWTFSGILPPVITVTGPAGGDDQRSLRIPGCEGSDADLHFVNVPNYGTPAAPSATLGAILLGEPATTLPAISVTDPMGPARNHEAVELTFNKRFSNNWQLYGSAVWADPAGDAPAEIEFGRGETPADDPCLEVGAIGADGQPLPDFFRYGAGVIRLDGPFVPSLEDFMRDPLCIPGVKMSFLPDLPDFTHVVLGEEVAGFDMNLAARYGFTLGGELAPVRDLGFRGFEHAVRFESFYLEVPSTAGNVGGQGAYGGVQIPAGGGLFVMGIDLPKAASGTREGGTPWLDANGDGQRDLTFLNGGDFQTPCPGVQYGTFTIQPGEGGGYLVPDLDAPPIDCDRILGNPIEFDGRPLGASSFFNTGNLSHELKFGGSYRSSGGPTSVNDRWRLTDDWSFNLGARQGEEAGVLPADATRPDPSDFEVVLGGPILRDRLWIWGSYDIPPDEPAGDFAEPASEGIQVAYGDRLETFLDPLGFNPSFIDVGRYLEGQNYGARLRIEGNGARYGPGGSIADLADERPLLLFESLGGSTGEVVRAHLLHDGAGPVSAEGFAVLEPVETTDRLRERFDAAIAAAAAKATATVEAYCLDKAKLPLSQGELFRLAPRAVQEAYAHVGGILDAAERLEEAGLLSPDTNPASYFHSIRQWSIWTRAEGYDRDGFVQAFVEHTRKNVEDGGQRWTDEIEEIVRRSAGGRWRDVEKVLDAVGTR